MSDLAAARFDALAPRAVGYESFYLKAGDREGRRAVWIRYTVHKRPGAEPEGSVWMTIFERGGRRPRAVKQTAAHLPEAIDGGYIAIGALGSFSPDSADGNISGEGRAASWKLGVTGGEIQFEHLPHRLYGAPLPRTKLLTLTPQALFTGTVEFDGETIVLDEWPGMIGHNWGSQHAEQWVWLHGTGFAGHGDDTWIDIAAGRVKVGPLTTPWVANGAVSVNGQRHEVGGLARTRAVEIDARAGRCEFTLPSDEFTLVGTVSAPAGDTVAWLYADPDGSTHHTLNCSVAELRIDAGGTVLETEGGAVYEYGSRDTGHGIPIEPFEDG